MEARDVRGDARGEAMREEKRWEMRHASHVHVQPCRGTSVITGETHTAMEPMQLHPTMPWTRQDQQKDANGMDKKRIRSRMPMAMEETGLTNTWSLKTKTRIRTDGLETRSWKNSAVCSFRTDTR